MFTYKGVDPESCAGGFREAGDKLADLVTDYGISLGKDVFKRKLAEEIQGGPEPMPITPDMLQQFQNIKPVPNLLRKGLEDRNNPMARLNTDPDSLYYGKSASINALGRLAGQYAAGVLGASGIRTALDPSNRSVSGASGTFYKHLADPTTWIMGLSMPMMARTAGSAIKKAVTPAKKAVQTSGAAQANTLPVKTSAALILSAVDKEAVLAATVSKFMPGIIKKLAPNLLEKPAETTAKGILSKMMPPVKTVAMNTALVGGLGALTDTESRQQHGFWGTFARKMASPGTWVVGTGATVATPLISKGMTSGLGMLGKATGFKPAQNLSTFFSGRSADLSQKGLEANASRIASQATSKLRGGEMRYIAGKQGVDISKMTRADYRTMRKGLGSDRMGELEKGMQHNIKTYRGSDAFGNKLEQGTKDYLTKGEKLNTWGKRLNPFNPFSLTGFAGAVTGAYNLAPAGKAWDEDFYKKNLGMTGRWADPFKAVERNRFRADTSGTLS